MEQALITLNDLKPNERASIVRLDLEGVMRRRLLDLGFIQGTNVVCVLHSPLGDPIAFQVRNTMIALRKTEASKIFVLKDEVN